ncbi:MAG: response regulator transcription factor [Candidatus Melainabacteria bacterium]|nr:response regulator transcription factor [Candidatus Melainabacteria bacterium]
MTTTRDITIFIAEDHPISLMGLKMMLEETAHFKIIGEAEDGRTAIDMVLEQKPDIVMMDLGLPEVDGIEATARIKEKLPGTRVLIFTAAEETDTIFGP